MQHSRLIAGFIGPLLAAMGIAMLVNRSQFATMAGQMAQDQGLIFLSGVLSLLAGIAIVRVHNVWSGGWRVLITVLGWLAVIGGVARIWFPQLAAPIAAKASGSPSALMIGGLIVLVLGAFLSYRAYAPET